MTRELISKVTRNEFREILTGFVLREIDMIFEGANLTPRTDYVPPVGGQRRSLVEQYYANIDFASPADVKRLATAYDEVIEQLRRTQNQVANPGDMEATIAGLIRRMERDGFRYEKGRFVSEKLQVSLLSVNALIALTEESISEHIEKARAKSQSGDHAGAIANAYTLVEGFLKKLLQQTSTPFKADEGDIRELYKLVAKPLNLNPSGEALESYLKSILQGLKNLVSGLYEIANKASDRHARRYNPAKHHAKLAVNAAFTLCEFLLESHEYQQALKRKKRA